MSNHGGCVNGTLVADYSAPMPTIGIYITVFSLVFLLMMLYDIKAAFHTRKRWVPCKVFTLNSVTLTFLAIATKLPVDLTTPMPRPIDQISKLTGTGFLCIIMGFLAPSLGLGYKPDTLMNMAALSIMVVTIVVDVCIQISTGVIVLFVTEHIIILCCMLLLLLFLWSVALEVRHMKEEFTEKHKDDLLKNGGLSMFVSLRVKYRSTYSWDPQYRICEIPVNACIGLVCLVCLVVQVRCAIISLILHKMKFCNGVSDYRWSMIPIVGTQMVAIIVASFAIIFRSLTMFCNTLMEFKFDVRDDDIVNLVINKNPILGKVSTWRSYGDILSHKYMVVLQYLTLGIILLPALVIHCLGLGESEGYRRRLVQKAEEDIERMKDASGSELAEQLHQLLKRTSPSGNLPASYGIDASPLSIVLLVRIAQFYLPDEDSQPLVQSFTEVNEIIHFVYETVWPKTSENKRKSLFAKAVWAGRDFKSLMPDALERTNLEFAQLPWIMPRDFVSRELYNIMRVVDGRRSYSSAVLPILEQLFIDSLHTILTQLPVAIFQSWNESPAEELNKRARFALQVLFKIQKLKNQFQWVFPKDSNIDSLITELESDSTDDERLHGIVPDPERVAISNVPTTSGTCDDEIIEVV